VPILPEPLLVHFQLLNIRPIFPFLGPFFQAIEEKKQKIADFARDFWPEKTISLQKPRYSRKIAPLSRTKQAL
jgi:hypothetical protein